MALVKVTIATAFEPLMSSFTTKLLQLERPWTFRALITTSLFTFCLEKFITKPGHSRIGKSKKRIRAY